MADAVSSDRVEGPQAEPDEPEAEAGDRREHESRDDELDRKQPMECRVHVPERRRDQEHRLVTLRDRRPDAVLRAAVRAPDGEVPHGLRRAVRGRRLHGVREIRRGDARARERRSGERRDDSVPVERAHLHERARRRRADAAARTGSPQRLGRLVERRVGAVEQVRAQGRVRRDVRGDEPDRRERDDPQQEPRSERQALDHP